MTKLFNKEDILTVLTTDKAKIGDKGYFGDNLRQLNYNVVHDEVHSLVWIDNENYTLYSFKGDHHADYFALFLPADKVKKKEPVYRPLKNIDELFSFLVPNIAKAKNSYTTLDKVGIILCAVLELKGKNSKYIYYKKFSHIYLTDDVIVLDNFTLNHYFEKYEIKKDGEWVPFGIKEE